MRFFRVIVAGLLGAALWFGSAAASERVVVFAAASLKNALDAANEVCARGTAAISYAASSALARQIEAGAPADLFISADLDWMDYLAGKNLIRPETRVDLLGNQLVLIAPAGSEAKETALVPGLNLEEMLGDGRLAVANVEAVPAGRYAKAALEGIGVWRMVKARLAQAENVRAALKLVATGEAPLGIVYLTDAHAEPGVKILGTFGPRAHPPIIYPAALVARSDNTEAAAFLACLQSGSVRSIFEAEGFTVLATVPSR